MAVNKTNSVRSGFKFVSLTFFYVAPVFLSLFFRETFAQTDIGDEEQSYYQGKHYIPLKGEQDSDYPRGVYLITDDVVVPQGKTMTFMPGTLVLFKKDTRISVTGRLICQGNSKGTITFARLANDKYFIPLDPGVDARWDGIFVGDSGSIEFSFTYINGSKYGIENVLISNGTILLDTVMFQNNKFQNLKVEDNRIDVPENKFIFYSSKYFTPVKARKKAVAPLMTPEQKRASAWKAPVRITLGLLALAGAAAYAVERVAAEDYQKKSDAASNTSQGGQYQKKGEDAALIGNIGGIVGIAGAVGFTITLFF
jgi:hypothetical protein